jgi:hypothetical protein
MSHINPATITPFTRLTTMAYLSTNQVVYERSNSNVTGKLETLSICNTSGFNDYIVRIYLTSDNNSYAQIIQATIPKGATYFAVSADAPLYVGEVERVLVRASSRSGGGNDGSSQVLHIVASGLEIPN